MPKTTSMRVFLIFSIAVMVGWSKTNKQSCSGGVVLREQREREGGREMYNMQNTFMCVCVRVCVCVCVCVCVRVCVCVCVCVC